MVLYKNKILYDHKRIVLRIINNFPLCKKEEERIREKFVKEKNMIISFEFYVDHGDNTEGAEWELQWSKSSLLKVDLTDMYLLSILQK